MADGVEGCLMILIDSILVSTFDNTLVPVVIISLVH
jgi:hypothetical protein